MLDEALARFVTSAADAWPRLRGVSHEAFAAHVRGQLPEDAREATLETLHGADLYLAFACLQNDADAWRELDRTHLRRVSEYVARIDRSPTFADEVRQRLALKLGGPTGKLASFTGRGPLGAWLRVAAVREAQTLARSRNDSVDSDEIPLAVSDADPELALLKRRSAAVFTAAFEKVLASLHDEERTILRLYVIEGLTYEELGRVLQISRASAARRVTDARALVLDGVQRALRAELGKNAAGAETLFALVESQLDLSVIRHLKGADDRP